jgi:hypothetical protein
MSTSETVRVGVSGSDEEAPHHRTGLVARPWRVFVVVLVLAFLNMAVWSLATPLFASPDEPAQVARAVALDHGQLIGQTVKNAGNAITHVTIPEVYAAGRTYGGCFTFKDTVSASCAKRLTQSKAEVRAITYVGRYPPLYYAIVGLPSLFTASSNGLYAMRLTSALLNAVFLALGAFSIAAWSRSRFLLVGLLVAATPMTFFLGSVVNPSGLEIMSALCLWCAGLVLALERADKPPPGLVAVVAVSAITLLLSRALSPLWVVCILVLLALLTGWRGLGRLARARCVRWALVPLVPAAAFAIGWIVVAHALDLLPVGVKAKGAGTPLAANILGDTATWVQQMIGIFGWLDTLSPLLTYLFWYAAIGLFVLLALSCAPRRHAGALVLLVLVVVFVPVAISYGQAHRLGVIWQARYIMPMAVGVPLMAVALVERSGVLGGLRTRVATLVSALLAVAAFAAFAEALRRYVVGVQGPIDYLHGHLHGSWQPPFGATTLTVAAFVLIALLAFFLRHLVTGDPITADPDPPDTVDPGPLGGRETTRPEAGKHVRNDATGPRVRVRQASNGPELGF